MHETHGKVSGACRRSDRRRPRHHPRIELGAAARGGRQLGAGVVDGDAGDPGTDRAEEQGEGGALAIRGSWRDSARDCRRCCFKVDQRYALQRSRRRPRPQPRGILEIELAQRAAAGHVLHDRVQTP